MWTQHGIRRADGSGDGSWRSPGELDDVALRGITPIEQAALRAVPREPCRCRWGDARPSCRRPMVLFVIALEHGEHATFPFDRLLRAVFDVADEHGLRVKVRRARPSGAIPAGFAGVSVAGILGMGNGPVDLSCYRPAIPSVWMMEGCRPPSWSDEVVLDDAAIGEAACRHLLRRGHRRLACLGAADAPCTRRRAAAFEAAATAAGAEVRVLPPRPRPAAADVLFADGPIPTGIFVQGRRSLIDADTALRRRGVWRGANGGTEIVYADDQPLPFVADSLLANASITVSPESLGAGAIAQVAARIGEVDRSDREQIPIGPVMFDVTGAGLRRDRSPPLMPTAIGFRA